MFFLKNTSEQFKKSPSRYLGASGVMCGILFCIESVRRYFFDTDIFGVPTYQAGDIGSLLFSFSLGVIITLVGIHFYRKPTTPVN
ncbi:hypothetical protein [Chania multitudinisentens]|uniref:hypothetical protein n=1 Tax=Chania multitudinisentens TaxID=1639108 RepID=UPI0012B5762D|nr:hypothetical protein [Chania multitudinisentens]